MPEEHTKVDPNSPAFPLPTFDLTRNEIKYPAHVQGMSKREYFAAMAMQGLLASGVDDSDHWTDSREVCEASVHYADALISALNHPQTPQEKGETHE